jgi:hypothetical protein
MERGEDALRRKRTVSRMNTRTDSDINKEMYQPWQTVRGMGERARKICKRL